MLAAYLPYLAATIVIEGLLALALARRGERGRLLRDVCLLNLFTHPLATLLHLEAGVPLLIVELLVFGAEAVGYRLVTGLRPARALLVSFVLNAATTALAVAAAAAGTGGTP